MAEQLTRAVVGLGCTRAREHGLLAINAGADVIRLLPPLIINDDDVGRAVYVLGKALAPL